MASLKTVKVPERFAPIFEKAEDVVARFFSKQKSDPSSATIEIQDSRYVLLRGASLSVDFFFSVRSLFGEGFEREADNLSATLLYDLAHSVGKSDARRIHEAMNLEDPIEKMSAGPVHFAHTGWAFVDILPESAPSKDENMYLIYDHPYSFESDAWVKAGQTAPCPICVMNAGYSSGWCEESFGLNLEAIEIACRACGDDHCRFIMSPPHRIEEHVSKYFETHRDLVQRPSRFKRPDFFARREMFDASLKGDMSVRPRSMAERKLLDYSRHLESVRGMLNDKVEKLQVENTERHKAEDALEKLNETLEAKVQERTAELEAANRELQSTLEMLQEAQRELIRSEKMAAIGGLVAGLAHEINTPIGVGVTAASHLERLTGRLNDLIPPSSPEQAEASKMIEVISEASAMILTNLQRASELIQSFKRVAVDQSIEEERTFRVREYLQQILLSLRPILKKAEHRLSIVCADDLTLRSFPGDISQIVTNFIMNSITHAYEKDETGKISIEVTRTENQATLVYSDDGKGVPPAMMDKIFDPFVTTKRSKGGTGLGLHIVYNIVTQKLGGNISCVSESGDGTKFLITIPQVDS